MEFPWLSLESISPEVEFVVYSIATLLSFPGLWWQDEAASPSQLESSLLDDP